MALEGYWTMSVLPVLAVQWLDVSQMVTAGYNLFKSWRVGGGKVWWCSNSKRNPKSQHWDNPATSQISGAAIPLKVLCWCRWEELVYVALLCNFPIYLYFYHFTTLTMPPGRWVIWKETAKHERLMRFVREHTKTNRTAMCHTLINLVNALTNLVSNHIFISISPLRG